MIVDWAGVVSRLPLSSSLSLLMSIATVATTFKLLLLTPRQPPNHNHCPLDFGMAIVVFVIVVAVAGVVVGRTTKRDKQRKKEKVGKQFPLRLIVV